MPIPVDAQPDHVARDELLAQGDRLLEQSQRLIADLDEALRRGSKVHLRSHDRGAKQPIDLRDHDRTLLT